MQLPIAFENRMKELLGAEYGAFYDALCGERAVKGLRVNRYKLDAARFLKHAPFDLTPLSYTSDGFIVSEEAQAGKHPYHHAGVYYLQDPGAMATVAALPAALWERAGLRVLDLCAAPGGKTTQLAALCGENGGMVLANEYNAARSRILAGNVERMGLSNVCVTNLDSKYLAQWYPAYFDLVVVDAPCSGEGMYRKNELAISEWSPENVTMCAARQKEILDNAEVCVAAGGYLLYSTCTYSVEENEETVAAFLARHPDFHLCACSEAVVACTAAGVEPSGYPLPDHALCRRFYPHVSPGEGQFVALLQRADDAPRKSGIVKDAATPLGKVERVAAEALLKECAGTRAEGLLLCGGNAVHFPIREAHAFCVPPFGVVSLGVTLGEVRKGRVVPHHHFFTAYGKGLSAQAVFVPDDGAVSRYLAGEEIEVDPALSGYAAILLSVGETAVTLGGGKAVGGRLKNYYPKGLRVASR